jgi:E3 ubiquitin-protein ligase DOA10
VETTATADGASTEQTHWGLNTSITHVMEILIAPVNTAPTFTMLTSGVRACYNFPAFNGTVADNISAGPFEEQAIEFIVSLVDGDG